MQAKRNTKRFTVLGHHNHVANTCGADINQLLEVDDETLNLARNDGLVLLLERIGGVVIPRSSNFEGEDFLLIDGAIKGKILRLI